MAAIEAECPKGQQGATPLVWIDQNHCTGDGVCAMYSPEIFELDIDGLAYVKSPGGELARAEGERVPIEPRLLPLVADAARDCPGACIHLAGAEIQPAQGPGAGRGESTGSDDGLPDETRHDPSELLQTRDLS